MFIDLWNSLNPFMKVIWSIALIASLIFIIQTIMAFVGADTGSDGDFDASFDTDVDIADVDAAVGSGGSNLYTFRNFVNFFLGFGWTAVLLNDSIKSRGLLLLFSVLVACIVLLASPTNARADFGSLVPSKPVTSLKGALTIYKAPKDYFYYREFYGAKNQVKALKSSNKKVLDAYSYGKYTTLEPKKAGKSTITFTYRGKKYKATVTVLKYANPVASVKVGAKTYANPFKSKAFVNTKTKLFKGKTFKVTPKAGWKLAFIKCYYLSGDTGRLKTIKNGGKLPDAKVISYISIVLKNTKTGGYEEVLYYFD